MKVVITGHPFASLDIAQKIFKENGIDMELFLTKDPEEIVAHTKKADAIISGMEKYDKKIIDRLEQCKILIRLGVGYDTIDVAAATSKGIMVVNVPDFCTEEVADHTMALILVTARQIVQGQDAVKEGKWGPKSVDINSFHRLKGRTLGLFGLGRISRLVAARANGFGMHCLGFDPFVGKDAMAEDNVEKVDMKGLLGRSDYVTLHSPLTRETENTFDLEKFRAMKRTAWIINTSRGPIIREEDLVRALDEGLIAGAALDVLAVEPPNKDAHPLFHRDNVIITPHSAWMSLEARDDLQAKGAEEVVRALKGERPRNLVNPEVLNR